MGDYFKCFRNRSTKTKMGKAQQTASLKEEAAAALWWEALRDAPSTALGGVADGAEPAPVAQSFPGRAPSCRFLVHFHNLPENAPPWSNLLP